MCYYKLLVCCLFIIYYVETSASVDYCEIEKTKCKGLKHIGCNPEVKDIPKCTMEEMTEERKNYILHVINEVRSKLATGQFEGLDAAGAVHELSWDDDLAYLAVFKSNLCSFKNDECRVTENFRDYGQVIIQADFSNDPYETAFQKKFYESFSQYKNATMENIINATDTNPKQSTAFFRRFVTDRMFFIGCSVSKYTDYGYTSYFTVCNTDYRRDDPVYMPGEPCSLCDSRSEKYPNLCLNPKKEEEIVADKLALASVLTVPSETNKEACVRECTSIGPINDFMFFGDGINVNINNYN